MARTPTHTARIGRGLNPFAYKERTTLPPPAGRHETVGMRARVRCRAARDLRKLSAEPTGPVRWCRYERGAGRIDYGELISCVTPRDYDKATVSDQR